MSPAHVCCQYGGVGAEYIRGWRGLLDRFTLYGIKVSFWGSGTLKIVIYVESYPQKRSFRLDVYHPLWVGGVN